MTDGWMTRREAAEYLKVSTRQLARLPVPRAIVGRSPRYSRVVLEQYMQHNTLTPGQRRKKSGPLGPLSLPYLGDGEEAFNRMLAKAKRPASSRRGKKRRD